jgi:hypothetical protein
MKHKKIEKNYLDFVPSVVPGLVWKVDKDNMVVVDMENTGFYNRLAQKLFHRPKVSHIKLDELGSFIWNQMDGRRTVYDISELVKARFGDKAEPLLDRLVKFLEILKAQKWINLEGRK